MALTERERGFGASMFERLTGSLTVTRRQMNGPAKLLFPCGQTHAVEAQLFMSRSAFSLWGEGYFHCPAGIGFAALYSKDWLTLSLSDATTVDIEINEIKARDGQCRCRFEVKS